MSYEIDGVIEAWLNVGEGASGVKWNQPYTETLIAQAFREAISSPVGRELSARVGDTYNARIMAELSKRFDKALMYPAVYTRARIEEVMQDLLLDAPPAPVRPAGVNEHGVNLNFETGPFINEKEETEIRKFAHLLNEHLKNHPVPKPVAGFFTLEIGGSVTKDDRGRETRTEGRHYEFKHDKFLKLLDAADARGLVRRFA